MTVAPNVAMSDTFTVQRMGAEDGPYTFADLQAQVRAGTVRTSTQLRRDVRAHETMLQLVMLRTPATRGAYEVEIAVRQRSGEGFVSPPSRALRGRIKVE